MTTTTIKRLTLLFALLLALLFPPPVHGQEAPNRRSVVQAVMDAHPEVDRCNEDARGAIVDWAAQRLNAEAGRVVWGRKSRGRVVDGKADRPNTDGLTYRRSDGLFEIFDVISGSPPCRASWGFTGPFRDGENGHWAPPQLGPEPGTAPPPPDPTDPPPPPGNGDLDALRAKVAELERRIVALEQGTPTTPTEPTSPTEALAILREQLETSKAILEILRRTAERFGIK